MNRVAMVALIAAFAISTVAPAAEPMAKGLAVHEWGVFKVSQDVDFANAAMRAVWDELPQFVYGHIKGRAVPQHWGAFELRNRPIIFFHAQDLVLVRVKVDFPGGMAGVWYPATDKPAVFGAQKQPKVSTTLEWNVSVKQPAKGWLPKSPIPVPVSEKHWFERLRQVKSDEIFAQYSPNPRDVEREKFIYYDGLFPHEKWLDIKVDNQKVVLTSKVKHPVFDVTVVDRRSEKVRVGRFAKFDAGAVSQEIAFTDADASRFASEAAEALTKQLTGAGLFEDEAKSLVDLWKQELFESPGLSLFYRLSPAEYDARLPLTITPKPDSVVRVGLIHHSHLEPDFAERILELVKQLDAAKFAERDAAMKKLQAIGPAALVQMQRLRERKDLSVEVRERIDALVKKWSAKEAFDR